MTCTDQPILIIGAGLAGLFLALKLAPMRVVLATPSKPGIGSSSAWAQGGLAAALDPEDSPEAHAEDTILAGAGLSEPGIALLLAREGPARVRDLLALGVPFDRTESGALALSLEAAHSRPRVARVAGDLAGKAIIDALCQAVLAAEHIEIFEPAKAVALLQTDNGVVCGARFTTAKDSPTDTQDVSAAHVVLSTGGIGGLFRVTTNPRGSIGDGIAMAAQAGAILADLEFIQFHPTAMDFDADPTPLATEALRGEGACLIDRHGAPFMHDYDQRGDLAARDVVARAIAQQHIKGSGAFLDARTAIGADFPNVFPTVYQACLDNGLDPILQPIPVIPAVHYHMGGILCDVWGQSSLEGLSVTGECASTGAHGGNRLASNSLLEAIVFSERIARCIKAQTRGALQKGDAPTQTNITAKTLLELRANMHNHCGVVREKTGLETLLQWIDDRIHAEGRSSPLYVAKLIADSALRREESRGAHYRSDFPDIADNAKRTFVMA